MRTRRRTWRLLNVLMASPLYAQLSVQGKYPLSQNGSFLFSHCVRWHGDRTVHTCAAVFDVVSQGGNRIFFARTLFGHFFVRRANQLVVNTVTSQAGLALEQAFSISSAGILESKQGSNREQWNQYFFHFGASSRH